MDRIGYEVNTEESFIFSEGSFRGFTMVANKVIHDYFLSTEAKMLYILIRSHLNSENGVCNPSQDTLGLYLGVSENTLRKYLVELETKGYLIRKKGKGSTNYYLPETKTIPSLRHSQILHEIKQNMERELFIKLFNDYLRSDYCAEINKLSAQEIIDRAADIKSYFLQQGEDNVNNDKQISSLYKNAVSIPTDVDVEKQGTRKRKKKVHHSQLPVREWTVHHLLNYFSERYKETYKEPYLPLPSGADGAQMSRLLKLRIEAHGEGEAQEKIKQYIDVYFDHEFFNKQVRTVAGFCSTFVQGKIDLLLSPPPSPNNFEGSSDRAKLLGEVFNE